MLTYWTKSYRQKPSRGKHFASTSIASGTRGRLRNSASSTGLMGFENQKGAKPPLPKNLGNSFKFRMGLASNRGSMVGEKHGKLTQAPFNSPIAKT